MQQLPITLLKGAGLAFNDVSNEQDAWSNIQSSGIFVLATISSVIMLVSVCLPLRNLLH